MVMFSRKCILEGIRRPVPKYFGRGSTLSATLEASKLGLTRKNGTFRGITRKTDVVSRCPIRILVRNLILNHFHFQDDFLDHIFRLGGGDLGRKTAENRCFPCFFLVFALCLAVFVLLMSPSMSICVGLVKCVSPIKQWPQIDPTSKIFVVFS